jgi:hypothetical protein
MRTFRAGNLEVMREDLDYPDFPLSMGDSEIESLDLGNYGDEGWRIPGLEEIKYLYKLSNCASYNRMEWNSQKWSIGNFKDNTYWAVKDNGDFVMIDFLIGSIDFGSKARLRLVRDIEQ